MIWLALGLLAAATLAPLAFALFVPSAVRGRAEADLALYRAQLAELDREREAGRLDATAYAAATLEVQRRVLAAPADPQLSSRGRVGVAVALIGVPALAFGLYAARGYPEVPSASFATRQQQENEDDTLLATLRLRMAHLDPSSDAAVKGWTLLGNAERTRGRPAQAIEAYRLALSGRFEADTAGQLTQTLLETGDVDGARTFLAQSLPRAPNHIGLRFLAGLTAERSGRPDEAKQAWASLLRDAPADAPWKVMVERRMESLP